MEHGAASRSDPAKVLAKAYPRAAAKLGLTETETAAIIGLDEAELGQPVDPNSGSGQKALWLVAIATSLYALTGGDEKWMRAWLRNHNKLTGGIPAEQIKSAAGLARVARTVDALRGPTRRWD
ncbi:MAG: MbcA/ParS/Xre antitoxin family protein [Desulfuromonadales bacterium]